MSETRECSVTVVCQYSGQQDPSLRTLLSGVISEARKLFSFEHFDDDADAPDILRTHFTFRGLEATFVEKDKAWYSMYAQENTPPGSCRPLSFGDIVTFLKGQFVNQITVQFGGFKPGRDYGVGSPGPFERSFYIGIRPSREEKDTGPPVVAVNVAGWPVVENESGQRVPNESILAEAREKFKDVNIFGKWATPDHKVRDLYCKLGPVLDLDRRKVDAQAEDMRQRLASHKPIYVKVHAETMAVVKYDHSSLPPSSTAIIPVRKLSVPLLTALFCTP